LFLKRKMLNLMAVTHCLPTLFAKNRPLQNLLTEPLTPPLQAQQQMRQRPLAPANAPTEPALRMRSQHLIEAKPKQ